MCKTSTNQPISVRCRSIFICEKCLFLTIAKMNSTIDSPKFGLIRNRDHRGVSKADMSMAMSTSDMRRFMNNSNETLTTYKHSMMEESTTDVLTTKQKTNLLYGHFLEIIQSRTNDSEVFETVQDLITGTS